MKTILVIHLNDGDETETIQFLHQDVQIRRIGCGGDPGLVRGLIAEYDGRVAAIGLEGFPAELELGPAHTFHQIGQEFPQIAHTSPIVDGHGVRAGLERWGVILADRAQPGIFAQKQILMVPGLNHNGLSQSLARRSSTLRYADPVVYFALPQFPGVGSRNTLDQAAAPTLEQLKEAPFRRIKPQAGVPGTPRAVEPFQWADVLAGDIGAIRRYAPENLKRKTIVVECATEEDLQDLRQRGASILVTMMPSLNPGEIGRWSAATIEAILVALRTNQESPLNEDTYLDLMADINWTPAIRYLQPADVGINKFAFVIHPLNIRFIHKHRLFRWTRYLPDELVERVAAYIPPLYLSRITGAQSPTTGQKVEGYLISLAKREMLVPR